IDPITNQPRETTYQYGTLGELRSVTLPDNTTIRYYQNANNQRIAKEVNGTIVQVALLVRSWWCICPSFVPPSM
ncbi:MAG: hypothetical protein LBT81_04490, partial [Helicobacteraceae bacterium]|nr:hypothetical protein [Helicobacteraceae bacterium]